MRGIQQVWLAGALLVGLTPTVQGQDTRNMNPVWSPDGKLIAFVSNRDGGPDIYLMDSSGGSVENLTADEGFDLGPSWSHDGRRIAFVSNRGGDNDLYVLTLDAARSRR